MDLTFGDLAFWIGIMSISVFMIGLIPGIYIPYLIFKKQKFTTTNALVFSILIGLIIALISQSYILSVFSFIRLNEKPLSVIALPFFLVLEIVIVMIHFFKYKNNKKGHKRRNK